MLWGYGRSLATKELLAEMDHQDIEYRLQIQLPPPLQQSEAEIEIELRLSAGADWDQTAKKIRAVEKKADRTTVLCFPVSSFSCFFLCICINSEVSTRD